MNICFDTETTGLNFLNDEVLQLSIIDADTGKTLFNEYMKPTHTYSWEQAQAVNGIASEMVEDCLTIEEYRSTIQRIFDKADTVLGYNVNFDVGFLRTAGIKIENRLVDVMTEFAEIYGEWNDARDDWKWQKLTTAAAYYGLSFEGTAHDSLADAKMTAAVYKEMHKN